MPRPGGFYYVLAASGTMRDQNLAERYTGPIRGQAQANEEAEAQRRNGDYERVYVLPSSALVRQLASQARMVSHA